MKSQTYIGCDSSVSRSVGIPMPANHIHRTESELQFHFDMVEAESRDLQMFHRLIKGISLKQQHIQSKMLPAQHKPFHAILSTEQSLMNIISTRHQNIFTTNGSTLASPPRSSLLQQEFSESKSEETTDDWSLSGYDSNSSSCNTSQFEQDDSWNDSDTVFDIDL